MGHLDLDYFYAQVEELEDTSLRDLPSWSVSTLVAPRTAEWSAPPTTGPGNWESGPASPSPLPRSVLQAKKRPSSAWTGRSTRAYSERVMEILRENVDVMEQTGIDEAFFDITKGSGE